MNDNLTWITVFKFAQQLDPFEVQREERQHSNPDLVSLRGHVKPNERCAPRELNALKFHGRGLAMILCSV
jgi:hypothetical protein